MKKIKLLLVTILAISLFGCSSKEATANKSKEKTNEQTAEETVGNINDYLVEAELNDSNFNDYFEFNVTNNYDDFGEIQNESYFLGLKSKKYDEGLVIYDMDDITIRLSIYDRYDYDDSQAERDDSLDNILYFGPWISGYGDLTIDDFRFIKMTPGTIRFIKSEYIESYEIEDYKEHDYNSATITLKNGETITRTVYDDYKY